MDQKHLFSPPDRRVVKCLNKDAPLQQRLLCRTSACWPEDLRPCTGKDFEPIVPDTSLMIT
jgi:hypothetical protein